MKNKIWMHMFSILFSALIMMGGFSMTAYAGGGEETDEFPEETVTAEIETTQEAVALTPEGNLTLVDDISGETSGDKQFITVITRNGNYFYIIIDRAEDGDNTVHFLNQVDEADLMTIIEDGEFEVQTSVVTPQEPVPSPKPEPEPEKSGGGMGSIFALILILALGGGGAFYYFKVMKPKQSAKGGGNLDDFDFEDDEDEEYETEMVDLEQKDEQEDTNE